MALKIQTGAGIIGAGLWIQNPYKIQKILEKQSLCFQMKRTLRHTHRACKHLRTGEYIDQDYQTSRFG